MMKQKKEKKEKKKLKDRFHSFCGKVKHEWQDFRYNPRLKIKKAATKVKKFVLDQRLFCLFILLNTLNGFLLRAFTLGKIESVIYLPPILADLAFCMLVASFAFLMKEKNRFYYWFVWTIFLSSICMINSAYYTFYDSFTSISFIFTIKYLGAVSDAAVEAVFQIKDFIYYFMPIIFFFVYHRLKKKKNIEKVYEPKFKYAFLASLVVALCFCCTVTATDIGWLGKQWARDALVKKFGIYVYHVNDLVQSIQPKIVTLFGYDSAVKEFNDYFKNRTKSSTNEYTDYFKGKNLIAIHSESMQNFVIGLEINGVEVTPNLNKLVKKSMYFDNFYAQVSVGTSSDTEFTLATSLMPATIGTAFVNYYDHEFVAMPQLFKDMDYYTFSMHANVADYWNRRIMHQNLGYEKFYAKDSFNIDETIHLGLSDVSFLHQAVEKLKTISEEHEHYFGTVITLSNHTPFPTVEQYEGFDVSDKQQSVYNKETGEYEEIDYPYLEGTTLGKYLKSVHYADYALGLFFKELEENNLLENTVIVLYGDHDARLPQDDFNLLRNYDKKTHDIMSSDDERYREFTDLDYELNRKVPLIIYSKDNEKNAKTFHTVMGMYDLSPTLGNMFGFHNPYALGHDIFNTIGKDNIVIFPTGNFITNKIYYDSKTDFVVSLDNNEKESFVDSSYVEECKEYTEKLLSVSDSILVFDLIRYADEQEKNDAKVLESVGVTE